MEKKGKPKFGIWYALSFALQFGFMVVFSMGGFMLLGFWLDKLFNSFPLLFIVCIVLGFYVTFKETYQMILPIIEKKNA